MTPTLEPHNSVTNSLQVFWTSTPRTQAADSSICNTEGGLFPKSDAMNRGVLQQINISSALTWEPQIPVSLHMTLVHSSFLLLQSRGNGCKRDFMHWTLKIPNGFLASSHFFLGGQNSHWFSHSDVIWLLLPGSGALSYGLCVGLRTHTSQGKPL